MTTPTETDLPFLLHAIDLAAQARASGDHPFGALLVDASGTAVATGLNSVVTASDPTGHAETNLVREVGKRFTPAQLSMMTIYASTEPCAMCAGAIYWSRIGAVVFALSETDLRAMTGTDPKNPSMDLPCREVFSHGARQIEVRGPFDLIEARDVHEGFWTP